MKYILLLSIILTTIEAKSQDTLYRSSYNSGIAFGKSRLIYELKAEKDTILRYFLTNNQVAIKGANFEGRLHGRVEKFYPNGQLYEVATYEKGKAIDTIKRWHYNGQLMGNFYQIPSEIQSSSDLNVSEKVLTFYDSIGNQTVTSGNGEVYITFPLNSDFQQGRITDGLKHGEWSGLNSRTSYVEDYKNGRLVQGTSEKDGITASYSQLEKSAEFKGGVDAFYKFLAENLKYPRYARKKNIQGQVFVYFIVEKNGELSNLKIVQGIGGGCDEETMRVIAKSPKWIPGKFRGQVSRQAMIQNINFKM